MSDNPITPQGWLATLSEALDARKRKMSECPVRRVNFFDRACPKCRATSSGPCWLNVEADAILVDVVKEIVANALPPAPTPQGWMPIETAPKDGTDIQAHIPGNGQDNVIAWQAEAFLNSEGQWCGGWVFTTEQEPPDCWTDGICWEVNEDGVPSVQPVAWMPLPPAPGESA